MIYGTDTTPESRAVQDALRAHAGNLLHDASACIDRDPILALRNARLAVQMLDALGIIAVYAADAGSIS